MKLNVQGKLKRIRSCAPWSEIPASNGGHGVRPALGGGYQLIECLVYIAILLAVLGGAYVAFYRFMDNSLALRRGIDDITSALHAGERWRADLREANGVIRVEDNQEGQRLVIPGARGEVAYQTTTNAVLRRVGLGSWTTMLGRVKSSTMSPDPRPNVTAWRWELELRPRSKKPVRVRPLFTFVAVPERRSLP